MIHHCTCAGSSYALQIKSGFSCELLPCLVVLQIVARNENCCNLKKVAIFSNRMLIFTTYSLNGLDGEL